MNDLIKHFFIVLKIKFTTTNEFSFDQNCSVVSKIELPMNCYILKQTSIN